MSTDQMSTENEDQGTTWGMTIHQRETSIRLLERSMKKAGGSLHALLDKIRKRDGAELTDDVAKALAAFDKGGLALGYVEPKEFQSARDATGVFVSPYDVMMIDKTPYTDGALTAFAATFPSVEKLVELREKGFGLVAGPPDSLTPGEVCDLRGIRPHVYELGKMITGEDDKVGPRWYAIKLEPVVGSQGKPPTVCKEHFLQEKERLPNLAEITWFASMVMKVHNRMLYLGAEAITSTFHSVAYMHDRGHRDDAHQLNLRGVEGYNTYGFRGDNWHPSHHTVQQGQSTLRHAYDALDEDPINVNWRKQFARQCLVPVLEL